MYKLRPKRDRGGKIINHDLQSKELPNTRIEPDRRWFDFTGRNALAGKENDLNPSMDKCSSSSAVNPITATKTPTSVSLSGGLSNGPSQAPAPMAKDSLSISHLPSSDSKGPPDLKSTPEEVVGLVSHVSQTSTLQPPSKPGVSTSVSDSVLAPSLEAHNQGEIITNKHASRSQRAAGLVSDDVSAVPKDTSQPSVSSSIVLPPGSRPSSSYSSRTQQPGGSQKGRT